MVNLSLESIICGKVYRYDLSYSPLVRNIKLEALWMLIENNEQNIPLDSAEDDYSKDEFEKIKKLSDSYFKQLQYLQADFENFRKQTNKEFEILIVDFIK